MTNSPNQADLEEAVLEIGARLHSGPSKMLINHVFADELQQQRNLFDPMGLVDIAFTIVGVETGVIPANAGRELIAKLLELQDQADSFHPIPERGDLYTNREAWLAERTDAVGWLGAGRARREASTTAFLMLQRQRLVDLVSALVELGRMLNRRARKCKSSLMPDYTYLQSAQPSTFGHYLLGFVFPVLRDCERLRQLYGRINNSPLGCGSTTGSSLVRDRQRMADLLGFDRLTVHTRDAMWQADSPIETAAALCACTINMSRLAEDLQIFSTKEFALVELSDRHARASKIMPHKKNPFALTHIRGVCNEMIGNLTTASIVGRTPSGQPDNRLWAYGALPDAMLKVRDTAELLTELIEHLKFDAERGRQLLDDFSVMATDLTEILVQECALDFRSAHRLVGYLVRRHNETGQKIDKTALCACAEMVLGEKLTIQDEAFERALDPRLTIETHRQPGSPADGCMENMLRQCDDNLTNIETDIDHLRRRMLTIETQLLDKAREIASS